MLYEVGLAGMEFYSSYNGVPKLSEHSSAQVAISLAHWQSELQAALDAGKLVVVLAREPKKYYRYTGKVKFSGTGRSRARTSIVELVSSYDVLAPWLKAESKTGSKMRLNEEAKMLAPYWNKFGGMHSYEAVLNGENMTPAIVTAAGNRVVAGLIRRKGVMLVLPGLKFEEGVHWKYAEGRSTWVWTKKGSSFAREYAAALVDLHTMLFDGINRTPPPQWTLSSAYITPEESNISTELNKADLERNKLNAKIESLLDKYALSGAIRALLFEQGKPLETAVIEVLTLFGFKAEGHREAESEFDAVFECHEGRCIGEVEGKDSKAVNIDKLSQLERNIQEDYARDGIEEYAKGVLFGNAQRLLPLAERGEFFTQKCVTGARRAGIALVRTPDLFAPALYLRNQNDHEYAKACRIAILAAKGEIVQFPDVPLNTV